jgi:hypothetical protein
MGRSEKPRRLYLKRGVFYGWYFDHQKQDYV